ncbi:chloride channel protein [Elysia marginata]|uniref:Chloride channel protein n=1 Tax=Elysia marginata TaxID=1093978 RepID=A0AAV4GZJ0_9GAST|nr:chloride channel protein [Elysia marginata]
MPRSGENTPLLVGNRLHSSSHRSPSSETPHCFFPDINSDPRDLGFHHAAEDFNRIDTVEDSQSRDAENPQPEADKHVKIEHEHILKAGFESLDYEVSDNLIYQKEEKDKSSRKLTLHWREVRRWIICFLIGVLTGLTAGIIDFGVEKVSGLKFQSVKDLVDKCVTENCMYYPLLVWLCFNMGLVLVGSILTAYIEEGPMIHSGAVIAAGVSQGRSTSLKFDFSIFKDFRSDREKRDFVSAGAAAGVAAAFGAPVGGVLFSLEEGASFWNQALVWRIFFSSMVSTMTLNIVQSYIKSHPWELSYAGLINFGTFGDVNYQFVELFLVIVMGAIGGLLGALFNHINYKLTIFRMRFIQRRWQRVIEVMMVAAYTAAFAYILIFFSQDCLPLVENRESMLMQYFCKDGEFSSSARLFFDTPEATVKNLFHSNPGTYRPLTLFIFAAGYFFLACWTYGLSVPSGLFIPSLLVGAAWGRIVGIVLSLASENSGWVNLSFYSLVGASAMLGGIVRMTISLTVIIMEATANVPLGLPVMISLIVAKWVGDQFNEGIYDIHIHVQGVPMLGWEPLPLSSNLSVKSVMSHPVTVFRMVETVERIIRVLKEEKHNGFPIVTNYNPDNSTPEEQVELETFGTFRGLILRSQLIMMLKKKLFVENPNLQSILKDLKMENFNDLYPRYLPIQVSANSCFYKVHQSVDCKTF